MEKARRAKKKVGKRIRSNTLNICMENGKPRMHNLNKSPLRINRCCQSITPSNTNSDFSPWHYFASVSTEVS